ncbi:MAG TPA: alkaline phosphatase family protein [Gemmatimonadaceae bacterium]|nr:alkaline phosphatase family protein [Gemmatimonadaceae bacterium]
MQRAGRLVLGAGALLLAACGSTSDATAPHSSATSEPTPRFSHVFVVVEENRDYETVIDGHAMPYLDSLAGQYGLATEYHADTHPSIGNYFMLTVGDVVTNDDAFGGTVTADNIVRELVAAGRTWKSYDEDLPFAGYTGGSRGRYARSHNPMSYLSDVVDDPAQRQNLVPLTQLGADLKGNALPDYGFIVPDMCDDAHNCPPATADAWLRLHIAPLISSAAFQDNGLLIIVFDEATHDDGTGGGGRVAWVEVSPRSKRGYRSGAPYGHESTLRLTAEGLGLARFPGTAAAASNMAEFFTGP